MRYFYYLRSEVRRCRKGRERVDEESAPVRPPVMTVVKRALVKRRVGWLLLFYRAKMCERL